MRSLAYGSVRVRQAVLHIHHHAELCRSCRTGPQVHYHARQAKQATIPDGGCGARGQSPRDDLHIRRPATFWRADDVIYGMWWVTGLLACADCPEIGVNSSSLSGCAVSTASSNSLGQATID